MFIDPIVIDTYFTHKMSTIHTISPVTSAVAVAYIEASSEDMSMACADDTCVAMTVITDCTDEVEDGVANANPYGKADDGAGGGPRGSGDGIGGADGSGDDGKDGGKVGSGVDGENRGGDGVTSRAVSVVLASIPRPLRESYLVPQGSVSKIQQPV